VHVVTVYPGPVRTAMSAQAFDSYGESWTKRLVSEGSPEKLARRIRTAIERRRPRVMFPASYAVVRHVPDTARWVLDRLSPPIRT